MPVQVIQIVIMHRKAKMSILQGIGTSLIAALIVFWLPRLFWRIQRRSFNAVFPVDRDVAIVVGSQTGFRKDYSKDLWVHSEAISSIVMFSSLLNRFGVKPELRIDRELRATDNFNMEVCIGGYIGNERTKWYLEKYASHLFDEQGMTVQDEQGLIVRLELPKDSHIDRSRVALLIYGQSTHDTLASVAYFCKHYKRLARTKLHGKVSVVRLVTLNEASIHHAYSLEDSQNQQ